MEKEIETWKAIRKKLKESIILLDIDAVNNIPANFKNNILWNVNHIIVTQQILCYELSGIPYKLDNDFINSYRKGTEPTQFINENEWKNTIEKIETTITLFETDFNNNVFQTYKEYPTSFGPVLKNVEDAVRFNNIHESLHLGYIMAIKKSV